MRALALSVSLFPLHEILLLSTGEVAQVIGVNRGNLSQAESESFWTLRESSQENHSFATWHKIVRFGLQRSSRRKSSPSGAPDH